MDLDRYFERIAFQGPRLPTLAVLRALALRHALSIPFENIDAFNGRAVSLDPSAVAAKLIDAGRGGWCFEQNLLLGEALRALGFDVADVAGRVLWGRPADSVAPRTHRALLVRVEDHTWLVDAGFGGHMLTGILDLAREDPQETPHGAFRLVPLGPSEYRVECIVRGEWAPMYRFDTQLQWPVDFEAANFQLGHDPASHFTQMLVVTRVAEQARQVLNGFALTVHVPGEDSRREVLGSSERVMEVLREVFGLALDAPTAWLLQMRLDCQRRLTAS